MNYIVASKAKYIHRIYIPIARENNGLSLTHDHNLTHEQCAKFCQNFVDVRDYFDSISNFFDIIFVEGVKQLALPLILKMWFSIKVNN